jgi:DsbC/DsbD-like thiol-disulfide interchange protein
MGTHLHASWASAFHLAALMAMGALSATAHAAGTPSPWATGDHSAVRLIAGPSVGATRTAGLEIRLDPGWQTYWKAPGESGAPPVFDWSASKNVAAVRVSFPAPQRFSDADGVTFGYRDDVILPLAVTPKDPEEAATLAGTVRYAVCGRVCIPVEAAAKLVLKPGAAPDAFTAARLEGFAGRVPHPATVGAAGALTIDSVGLDHAGGRPALLADTTAPAGGATLFAAGPGVGVPQRLAPGRWRVPLEHAKGKVELVLADADAAISVPVALDEMAAAP